MNNLDEFDYAGDNIVIQEMPQGCIISKIEEETQTWAWPTVQVASTKDALALIASLTKMLRYLDSEDII
jgi:hypothetical protein